MAQIKFSWFNCEYDSKNGTINCDFSYQESIGSMTLFVCHFVPPREVSDVVSLYLCQFFYPSACLCTVWPFNFTEIYEYDKINFTLSVISVITIFVELLQMI